MSATGFTWARGRRTRYRRSRLKGLGVSENTGRSIQGDIALDADEEKSVELKREIVARQEQVLWNPALSIPAN